MTNPLTALLKHLKLPRTVAQVETDLTKLQEELTTINTARLDEAAYFSAMAADAGREASRAQRLADALKNRTA